ncbi:hypothetical protein QBD00_000916 [Ochrobactrum sp. AN78]|nr:hypothetical protein [Ochrobactrum sp. AN78]
MRSILLCDAHLIRKLLHIFRDALTCDAGMAEPFPQSKAQIAPALAPGAIL